MSESAFTAVSSYGAGSYSTETRGIRPPGACAVSNSHYGNGQSLHALTLSKLARLEAEMSRNIDFYALLAPEMAGKTFVALDQLP